MAKRSIIGIIPWMEKGFQNGGSCGKMRSEGSYRKGKHPCLGKKTQHCNMIHSFCRLLATSVNYPVAFGLGNLSGPAFIPIPAIPTQSAERLWKKAARRHVPAFTLKMEMFFGAYSNCGDIILPSVRLRMFPPMKNIVDPMQKNIAFRRILPCKRLALERWSSAFPC